MYEVFNSNGQIAKRAETSNSSQTETINVTNLAPGFYIVRVSCEGQIAQQKIVKH
ncbi:MAG: T9SS type A sorting domain-containing protein [Chitinophagaceae bacterium]|nr:T9SS type A sorting domain-containing protein [Chitinophagaceae bacterium]